MFAGDVNFYHEKQAILGQMKKIFFIFLSLVLLTAICRDCHGVYVENVIIGYICTYNNVIKWLRTKG